MTEQAKGEAPAVLTPRLVFDCPIEDAVPLFLRKHQIMPREPGDPKADEVIIDIHEPDVPIAVTAPIEVVVDPVGTPEVINPVVPPVYNEAPTAIEAEAEAEAIEFADGMDDPVDPDDELTVEQLQRQQEELNRKIAAKREAEKKAVIEQIVNVVNTYNIPVEELVEALGGMKIKRKGVKAKPKYKDPSTGCIWSGRGKEPIWIRGKDRTPFIIPE